MTVTTKDILSADHEELGRLLNKIFECFELEDWAISFATLDLFWARLAMHIRAEHLHLFPVLISSTSNSVADMIAQLRADHSWFMEELASLIKQTRLLLTEEPDSWPEPTEMIESIRTLRSRLTAHDELEETAIYPLVEKILRPDEMVTLNTRIKSELEKLPKRFTDSDNFAI